MAFLKTNKVNKNQSEFLNTNKVNKNQTELLDVRSLSYKPLLYIIRWFKTRIGMLCYRNSAVCSYVLLKKKPFL